MWQLWMMGLQSDSTSNCPPCCSNAAPHTYFVLDYVVNDDIVFFNMNININIIVLQKVWGMYIKYCTT